MPKRRAKRFAPERRHVTREAGPVKGGTTVIAFVQDPDGYKIELIKPTKNASDGVRVTGSQPFSSGVSQAAA